MYTTVQKHFILLILKFTFVNILFAQQPFKWNVLLT